MNKKKYWNNQADSFLSDMMYHVWYGYHEEDLCYLDMFYSDLSRDMKKWDILMDKFPTKFFFFKEEHILFFSQFENDIIKKSTPWCDREIYPIHYFAYLVCSVIVPTHKNSLRGWESSRTKYYNIVEKIYQGIKEKRYSFSDILSHKIEIEKC